MASKYLNIKDHRKRKNYLNNELKYLSRKSFNLINGRMNYIKQPLLFNNILLNLLHKNSKLFLKKRSLSKFVIPKIEFSFNFILRLRKYLNNNLSSIKLLDYNTNNLVYYFNIEKNLKKNTIYIRTKNRCIITGRSHGVHRLFKLSRIKLRELGSNGLLLGLTKSSW